MSVTIAETNRLITFANKPGAATMSEMSREREREIHHWVMQTCLLFGSDLLTALNVSHVFIEGLREANAIEEPKEAI